MGLTAILNAAPIPTAPLRVLLHFGRGWGHSHRRGSIRAAAPELRAHAFTQIICVEILRLSGKISESLLARNPIWDSERLWLGMMRPGDGNTAAVQLSCKTARDPIESTQAAANLGPHQSAAPMGLGQGTQRRGPGGRVSRASGGVYHHSNHTFAGDHKQSLHYGGPQSDFLSGAQKTANSPLSTACPYIHCPQHDPPQVSNGSPSNDLRNRDDPE